MLEFSGKKLGKTRVEKLMKSIRISGIFEKRFKIKTTDSSHADPIAERIFTRKIVGFSMADHMRTELLLDALDITLGRQQLITSELLSYSGLWSSICF